MKGAPIKIFAIALLSAWVLVQLPANLFHHHEEEHCTLRFEKDSEGKYHFHEDLEEDCFCCLLIITKSLQLPIAGLSIALPEWTADLNVGYSFSFQVNPLFSKGRSPPFGIV